MENVIISKHEARLMFKRRKLILLGPNRAYRRREFSLPNSAYRMHLAPCHYCGLPPYTVSHRKKDQAFVYTGIDRVDNEKGYTPDNVVPCCGVCNFMKGKLGLEQFLAQIKRIHTFLAL